MCGEREKRKEISYRDTIRRYVSSVRRGAYRTIQCVLPALSGISTGRTTGRANGRCGSVMQHLDDLVK